MDTTVWLLGIFAYLWNYVESVPPAACSANFRWDDCGLPPKAVLYYYKSGSRCEVGLWRGCYPNPNMFKDEYECVNTCIFTVRAQPPDYHNINEVETLNHEISDTTDPEDGTTTPAGDKDDGSGSDSSGDGEHKGHDGSGGESGGGDGGVTAAPDDSPTAAPTPSG